MAHRTASNALRLRIAELFQVRLSKLMVLVAIIAILLSAWLYNREHSSSQRAWTSTQLFALNDRDATRRIAAVENLYTVEKEDLARTVAALAEALFGSRWAGSRRGGAIAHPRHRALGRYCESRPHRRDSLRDDGLDSRMSRSS